MNAHGSKAELNRDAPAPEATVDEAVGALQAALARHGIHLSSLRISLVPLRSGHLVYLGHTSAFVAQQVAGVLNRAADPP